MNPTDTPNAQSSAFDAAKPQRNPGPLVVFSVLAIAVLVMGFIRTLPAEEAAYDKVTGRVVDAVASGKEGSNSLTVQVWLDSGDANTIYNLAPQVGMEDFRKIKGGTVATVLAVKADLEKAKATTDPQKKKVRIASLDVDGAPVVDWKRFIDSRSKNQLTSSVVAAVMFGGGLLLFFRGKKKRLA
ncbi:MAG: hypothetical protein QM755_12485 [Luteolibacter sp.]